MTYTICSLHHLVLSLSVILRCIRVATRNHRKCFRFLTLSNALLLSHLMLMQPDVTVLTGTVISKTTARRQARCQARDRGLSAGGRSYGATARPRRGFPSWETGHKEAPIPGLWGIRPSAALPPASRRTRAESWRAGPPFSQANRTGGHVRPGRKRQPCVTLSSRGPTAEEEEPFTTSVSLALSGEAGQPGSAAPPKRPGAAPRSL